MNFIFIGTRIPTLMGKLFNLLVLSAFLLSCTKEDLRRPGIDNLYLKELAKKISYKPVNPFLDSFYFKGNINGKNMEWIVTDFRNGSSLEYRYKSASGIGTLNSNKLSSFTHYLIEDGIVFQNTANEGSKNYLAAGFNIASSTGNRTEINSWFMPGIKPFGKPRLSIADPVKNGVYIYYRDENGKEWISHNARSSQKGSYFESISLKDEFRTQVRGSKKWKARFSCKLYDQTGKYIIAKDCELYVPVLPNN
ncbi:MAG TPA: hypothetical protein VGO09_03380 [Flavisolibacter sp.]|jgi:phage pi2 protein 07|nr:hypothetical protein [Flavisolibacter sp.]